MAEAPFIPFEKDLMKLKEVVHRHKKDVNGKPFVLDFTWSLKATYQYMLDRYLFFKSNGKEFFDNQETMAENLGVSRRSMVSYVKVLCEFGIVEKKATRMQGAMHSNSYVVHDIFNDELFSVDSKLTRSVITEKHKTKTPPKTKHKVNEVSHRVVETSDYYLDKLPF